MKIEKLIGKPFVFQLKLTTITKKNDENSDIGIHIVSKQSNKSL